MPRAAGEERAGRGAPEGQAREAIRGERRARAEREHLQRMRGEPQRGQHVREQLVRPFEKRPDEARPLLDEAFRLGGDVARVKASGYPALAPLLAKAVVPSAP